MKRMTSIKKMLSNEFVHQVIEELKLNSHIYPYKHPQRKPARNIYAI